MIRGAFNFMNASLVSEIPLYDFSNFRPLVSSSLKVSVQFSSVEHFSTRLFPDRLPSRPFPLKPTLSTSSPVPPMRELVL